MGFDQWERTDGPIYIINYYNRVFPLTFSLIFCLLHYFFFFFNFQGFSSKIPHFHQDSFDLSDDTPTEPITPLFHRVACGLGHVLNDVIRQLFFSFRLVYFMNVLGLSASLSGWLLLEKQLVHIALSPVCVILVDRVCIPFLSRKIGKKKSWHLLGTILEAVFIPFFFTTHYLIQSEDSKTELMMVHLGILNVILAFGDSLLDISHLSLITVIATDQMEAVEMNSLRFVHEVFIHLITITVEITALWQSRDDDDEWMTIIITIWPNFLNSNIANILFLSQDCFYLL